MNSLWNTGPFENVVKRSVLPCYMSGRAAIHAGRQLAVVEERHALQARQEEFDLRVQGAVDWTKQRMLDYEQVLFGTGVFFINQHEVEHREFYGDIESLQLAQRFPGIQRVSYAPLVLAQRKQAHIAAVRKDGLVDYTIQPEGIRE